MPDLLAQAIATEGLIWLVLAVCVAGLVRGFSGFGSGMIIMPAAAAVLDPVEAIIFLASTEILGPLPNVPAAWKQAARPDLWRLILGSIFALPVGLWCLNMMEPTAFGWLVSCIVLALLVLLMSGWRYQGVLRGRTIIGAGALGGFMTGFAGLPGPPVILLYMASTLPVATIRANFLLFLCAIDFMLFPLLWVMGMAQVEIIVLGLLVGIPNLIANMVGARLFNPNAESLFRLVAYIIIAASAIMGLPIWRR